MVDKETFVAVHLYWQAVERFVHSAIKEAQATGINKVAETMHVQFIAKQIMQFAHELGLKVTGRDLGRLQDLVAHDPDATEAVYSVMERWNGRTKAIAISELISAVYQQARS